MLLSVVLGVSYLIFALLYRMYRLAVKPDSFEFLFSEVAFSLIGVFFFFRGYQRWKEDNSCTVLREARKADKADQPGDPSDEVP